MMMTGNRLMRSNILPVIVILSVVVISALLSTDILTDHKTIFRALKALLLAFLVPCAVLRLVIRPKPHLAEIAFAVVFVISAVTAVLTGSNSAHYVMTVDGPLMFCVCLSGMISLCGMGSRSRDSMTIFFAGVFSFSAFMLLSSFAGFAVIAFEGGFADAFSLLVKSDNWNGILSNPNAMATHMLAGVVSGALLRESSLGERRSKILRAAILAMTLLFVVDTLFLQCRGAFVSSLFFLAGWGIIRMRRRAGGIKRADMIRAAITAAALIALFAYLEYRFEILGRVIEKTRMQKSTYRIGFWMTFLQNQFGNFPLRKVLFGFGIQDPTQHWYNTAATWYGMHNFIFELWGRYGVFAAVIACVAIGGAAVKYMRRYSVDLFVIGFAAILMDNMLEDYLFIHVQLTTSMLGVFLFARIVSRHAPEDGEELSV